jgi:TrmH family RNA methyltransferase
MPFAPLSHAQHRATRALLKKSEREARREYVIEGEKLCREARDHAFAAMRYAVVNAALVQSVPNAARLHPVHQLAEELAALRVPVFQASEQKFHQLCDAATPQGIVAVMAFPDEALFQAEFQAEVLQGSPVLVLDGVADPGNVGTLIRTADWFGVRCVLLGGGSADRFHPKVLRSTMGSVFRCVVRSVPLLATTLQSEFSAYSFYGASLDGSAELSATRFQKPFGVVLGSESHGISPDVAALLAGKFRISGAGLGAESLNVAVAGGIVLHHLYTESPQKKRW